MGPARRPTRAMAELRLRKRARLKRKEIDAYASALEGDLGAKVFSGADAVGEAERPEYNVLFVNGQVLALRPSPGGIENPILTSKSRYSPDALL